LNGVFTIAFGASWQVWYVQIRQRRLFLKFLSQEFLAKVMKGVHVQR